MNETRRKKRSRWRHSETKYRNTCQRSLAINAGAAVPLYATRSIINSLPRPISIDTCFSKLDSGSFGHVSIISRLVPRFQPWMARRSLGFYSCFVNVMAYRQLPDLMLSAIEGAENTDVVLMAMDTVVREADCWTANDRWSRIVDVLMERLLRSSPTDPLYKRSANLLSELEGQGRLTKEEKKELKVAKEQVEKVSS